jgi:predicted nucleic acid-binding protein
MTFVDTNVFMYAVGGEHPLREGSRRLLFEAVERGQSLVTSAEVLQELLHAYLAAGRHATLDAALALIDGCVDDVWPVEAEDVRLARALDSEHPGLSARDLVHVASCRRRGVAHAFTFDRALSAVLGAPGR